MNVQLPLGVQLRDDARFSNFYAHENLALLQHLQAMAQGQGEHFLYCYGQNSVGKTHLLQACCYQAQANDHPSMYLPLSKWETLRPELLEGVENLHLLCLDNIEAIAHSLVWQEALFHCYNRIQQSKTRLVIAGICPPPQLNFSLVDLTSRLCAGVSFQLKPLSDEDKIAVLRMRAKLRGLELSEEIGRYLLQHYPRDMHALLTILEKLDRDSLSAQHKLTLPFVKASLVNL